MSQEEQLDAIILLLTEVKELLACQPPAVIHTQRGKAEKTARQDEYVLDPAVMEDIESEINPEWWYIEYGEAPHPAKYMDVQRLGYSDAELAFLTACLKDLARSEPTVNSGTHVFKFVGRKYCKAEKNTVSCYACVPVTG